MTEPDWADREAERIIGGCSCIEYYKGRSMVDPQCTQHDIGGELAEVLRTARREAAEQMREACAIECLMTYCHDCGEEDVTERIAKAIRALPLPSGPTEGEDADDTPAR